MCSSRLKLFLRTLVWLNLLTTSSNDISRTMSDSIARTASALSLSCCKHERSRFLIRTSRENDLFPSQTVTGSVRYSLKATVTLGKHVDINGSLSRCFSIVMGCRSILSSIYSVLQKLHKFVVTTTVQVRRILYDDAADFFPKLCNCWSVTFHQIFCLLAVGGPLPAGGHTHERIVLTG